MGAYLLRITPHCLAPCLAAPVQRAVPQNHADERHARDGEGEEKPGATEYGKWFCVLLYWQALRIFILHGAL